MRNRHLVVAFLLLSVLTPGSRSEIVIDVTTGKDCIDAHDDHISLREAVSQAATAPEDVTIRLLGGTNYALTLPPVPDNANLHGDLDVASQPGRCVTIQYTGSGRATVCPDAGWPVYDRVIHVQPGAHLRLENLIIRGGCAVDDGAGGTHGVGGGILVDTAGATLEMTNCRVIYNEAKGELLSRGGGVAVKSGGALTVQGGEVAHNTAFGLDGAHGASWGEDGGNGTHAFGGAFWIAGTAALSDCTIRDNTTAGGNGGDGKKGQSGDWAGHGGHGGHGGVGYGGALYMASGGVAAVTNVVLSENEAIGGAGGAAGDGGAQGDVFVGGYKKRGGDGGSAGHAGGSAALLEAGARFNGCGVRFTGNAAHAGDGGDGGDSWEEGLVCWYAGGAGGNGGSVYGNGKGVFATTADGVAVGGPASGNTRHAGSGGTGGLGDPDGANGTDGLQMAGSVAVVEATVYVGSEDGGSGGYLAGVTVELLNERMEAFCHDVSRSGTNNVLFQHDKDMVFIRVVRPAGHIFGPQPPSDVDSAGLSELLRGNHTLLVPLCEKVLVSRTGGAVFPYITWDTAARNIADAVAAAGNDGVTVLVEEGIYVMDQSVIVSNHVNLRSVSGGDDTILDGNGLCRCVQVTCADAVLDGFTIRNGYHSEGGGGVEVESGMVANCVITGNHTEQFGGGALIREHGLLRNCVVCGNRTEGHGGGVFCHPGGTVESCTIVGNEAGTGGGFYGAGACVVKNTVIRFNEAPADSDWGTLWGSGSFLDCCTLPSVGTGCVTNDPLLADPGKHDYRLLPDSPCRDSGANQPWMSGATDVRGLERVAGGVVDIGAYEFGVCRITTVCPLPGTISPVGPIDVAEFSSVTFTIAAVEGRAVQNVNVDGLSVGWPEEYTFWFSPGDHEISVACGPCYFVSKQGGNTFPYNSWAMAATDIADAVVAATAYSGPATVLVADGSYRLYAQIAIDKPMTIRSVNGSAATTVNAYGDCRCFNLSHVHAVVEGITVKGGYVYGENGAGVRIQSAGTVRNCHIRENAQNEKSTSVRSPCAGGGGGVAIEGGGWVDGCLITDNTAYRGAGLRCWGGVVTNCIISCNSANGWLSDGGGICCSDGTLVSHCIVNENEVLVGWGSGVSCSESLVRDCVICWNKNSSTGLTNAALQVCRDSRIEHCTIAQNERAGLVREDGWCAVRNTIIWNNCMGGSQWAGLLDARSLVTHCCTLPAVGEGCMSNSPSFVDAAAHDFRLQADSPCVDAGVLASGVSLDLNGTARPLDGNDDGTALPDIGAYEFPDATTDTDGDAMPDRWENSNGLNAAVADADGNDDNDAHTNLEEYLADTDPRDPDSILRIVDIGGGADGVTVRWQGGTRVVQYLEICTDLCASPQVWTTIFTNTPPTPITHAVIDLQPAGDRGYYRIRVGM
ncbi:MAG: hypothetical protein JXR37_04135 [Kiritimatiellae bacterium]|nr:hypothetical protein [Kiritimatiellia bacterium]